MQKNFVRTQTVGMPLVLGFLGLVGLVGPLSPLQSQPQGKVKQVEVGKNVTLEIGPDVRRVLVKSKVVLRDGPLEGLLTRSMAKEHEYILAADCDARHIHTALILAGAKPGTPAVFFPKYVAASGSTIKVSLSYKDKAGKQVQESAGEWMRDFKSKKKFDHPWVFGGSKLVPSMEQGKPPVYLANYGDLICVCNMETAMLDIPIASPKALDARMYEANPDKVPAKDTEVEVVLEVVEPKK